MAGKHCLKNKICLLIYDHAGWNHKARGLYQSMRDVECTLSKLCKKKFNNR